MNRIELIKKYLKASPGDNFLQHALALEYIKLGDYPEARHLFENILHNDPSYIGSYYHLAKLLERLDENQLALDWYEKGMETAKQMGENHAYNELRAAYEELSDM